MPFVPEHESRRPYAEAQLPGELHRSTVMLFVEERNYMQSGVEKYFIASELMCCEREIAYTTHR